MYSSKKIVKNLSKILPSPKQITVIEEREESFRFKWSGNIFRVSLKSEMIEQVTDDGFLRGTDLAAVLTHLAYQDEKVECIVCGRKRLTF